MQRLPIGEQSFRKIREADMLNIKKSKGKYNRKSILAAIKECYNGYSWNMTDFVYNPFSILQFFNLEQFQDYWFET
jgi:hypothetical protein